MKESRRSIDVFLEHAQVSKEQRKEVFSALEKNTKERIILDVIDNYGQNHRLIMSFEPLSKPSGFTLFCGHEFVEDRSSANLLASSAPLPTLFNRGNLNFLSYITGNMNIGSYVVDPDGKITYVNHTLEKWLQYSDNEIVAHGFSVRDLVEGGDGEEVLKNFNSFNGDVHFNRKATGVIKVFLNHKALYDEKGKVVGFLALVYLLDDLKKKNSSIDIDSW
jgi:PAS domain-containing protein